MVILVNAVVAVRRRTRVVYVRWALQLPGPPPLATAGTAILSNFAPKGYYLKSTDPKI